MRRRNNAGYGNNVLILRLQGFIFFFSAEMLRGTVLKFVRSCAEAKRPLSYIVLNFNMVDASGQDASHFHASRSCTHTTACFESIMFKRVLFCFKN